MSKVFVLAESRDKYKLFLGWQMECMRGDFTYLRTPDQLMGTFDVCVIRYGEYYKHPNNGAIEKVVEERKEVDRNIKNFKVH